MKIFLKSIIVVAILVGVILGYVREVPYFSNTFDIRFLFFRSSLLGALIGGLVGWFLGKKMSDKSDRLPIMLIFIFAGLAILPLPILSSNHILAKDAPLSIKVIFQKEEPLVTTRLGLIKSSIITVDAYYVYFSKDGKMDRFRSKTQSFKQVEAGQEIELPIKQGFWGYNFIDIL